MRPAVARDVAGRRILDAGCGSGPIAEALRERGAIVTGIDSSTKMVELARQRLGADTDLRVAELDNPLPRRQAEVPVLPVLRLGGRLTIGGA
jgi:predicted TPR repeat methyltransferase